MQGHKITHTIHTSTLKKMRITKGLKQSELSQLSGVPFKTIGEYEQLTRNINNAKACTLYKLAKALNCRIEDLINEEYL